MQSKLNPSVPHPEYPELQRKYEITDDAFEGDVCKYVPRLSGQTDDEYDAYKHRAANFNVVERTAQALVGAMTRKPYVLKGYTPDTFPVTDTNSPDTFIQYAIREILVGGRVAFLVDSEPASPVTSKSKIITLCAEDIINWGTDFFVIKECKLVPSPENRFAFIEVVTYRELYIDTVATETSVNREYKSRTWQLVNNQWVSTENPQFLVNGKPLDYIPLFMANPYDNTTEVYYGPLFTQAALNIRWYVQAADLAHYAHFMAIPTPTIIGELKTYMDPETKQMVQTKIYLGSTSNPTQLTQGSSFEYVEVSGTSFKMLQDEMKNTEERMYVAGSRLLTIKKGVESVEALQLRSGSESAVLETITNSLETALSGALELCSQIDRISSASIELNKDFTAAQMDPAAVKNIIELYTNGVITIEQALSALYEGEVVTPVAKTNTTE